MHSIFLTANTEFDYKVWIGFKTTFSLAEKATLSNKCPSSINVLLKLIYILTHIVDDNVQMEDITLETNKENYWKILQLRGKNIWRNSIPRKPDNVVANDKTCFFIALMIWTKMQQWYNNTVYNENYKVVICTCVIG